MAVKDYIDSYKSFIFDLDNVLYPEKDFLLQVYYLFAQFIEYSEQINAAEILNFMKIEFEAVGPDGIFEKTAEKFGIPGHYKLNFELLNQNAKLPLKLLLFDPVLKFLKQLILKEKQVVLLVSGNPTQQLNKIKQVEWDGLEQELRVYFADEIAAKPDPESLEYLVLTHNLAKIETLIVGLEVDKKLAELAGINFLDVNKLLLR